tara:strand:+ start:268 stop:477 length:210 start_codon:yes stop_codon:yes gene_type:complete
MSGKTIIKKGKENIYLPAKAIKTANNIETIIIDDLIVFATFFVELLANQLRNRYIKTKITSVIIKIFIY